MSYFTFNVLDWHELDENDSNNNKKYYIKCFGRTEDDKSVYLRIDDFPVHFYILIPENWDKNYINRDKENIIEALIKKNPSLQYSLAKDTDEKYISDIVEKKKFYEFRGNKKNKFLRLIFNNKKGITDAVRILEHNIYVKNYGMIKFELYENNIDSYLRFMHIRDIQSCGWIKIKYDKLNDVEEETTCNYNFYTNWCDVEKEINDTIAPFNICSFDLECKSIDGSFPQACREGDKIIQIGMTFNKYGSNKITKKIIISLNTCDDIIDTEVISVETEKELLLHFQKIIQREDPDILTGYNIFSFDIPYLFDRAKLLKINESFYYLSKLKDHKCKVILKNLSSAALGDNSLNYIDSLGRINIDIMKVIQRDYKLTSYKLDDVAENFIKDKIIEIENILITDNKNNKYKIKSKNIELLKIDNYIRLEKNGEILKNKYKIIDINHNENWFIINNVEDNIFDNFKTIYWGLVKDDIKPKQIFELFEKTSLDRKIIAEYCIQDCILVNKLMSKLEILTNNISMASICYVPLHFIFFRGQGIKSLSLVAKFCRKEHFLIPCLKKNEEYSSDTGFEGATVFDPMIGFHKKPIPVLDYNSLYPSSIISKNISHETLVLSSEYDNLENYIYYNVSYNNNDGSITNCKFAKLKDENFDKDISKSKFGIIPSILMCLLKERKLTKKEMEKENDAFKKSILDSKQSALKITANSIYGQLGAAVSPIYFKKGAACTTAIGRQMLEKAREFVENDFLKIMYELYDLKKNDINKYNENLIFYLKEKNEKFEIFFEKFIMNLLDNYIIKPKVIYGDSVMPYTPIILKINNEIKISKIEDIGLIFNNNWVNYDAFKNNDMFISNKQKIEFDDKIIYAYTHKGWTKINKLIRHKCNKTIYRINTDKGLVDVTEDHSLITNKGIYIKPEELNMNIQLMHSFPISSKIDIEIKNTDNIILKDQYMAQVCYFYLKNAGYNIKIDYNQNTYILSNVNNNTENIKKIERLYDKYDGYVYDIETEHGVFQAGIGEIIVKNTDSIFINMDLKDKKTSKNIYGMESLQLCIDLGICASNFLKSLLPYPHYMEYEKTFYPFALLEKKKYMGYKYELDTINKKLISMGVVLKRRDNSNIVKKIISGMVSIMFDEIDINKTIVFINKSITDLLNGKFDISDFITTKSLRSNYKGKKITSEIISFNEIINNKYNDSELFIIEKKDIEEILNKGKYKGSDLYINNININKLDYNNDKLVLYLSNELNIKQKKEFEDNFLKFLLDINLMIDIKNFPNRWKWDDVDCSQAHIRLAQRMAQRDKGNAPQINDRIPYVMIVPKNINRKDKLLQGDKIEHPDYIIENKLEIDYLFYLTNQIKNPSVQFLNLIMDKTEVDKLFNEFIDTENKKRRMIEDNNIKEKGLALFSKFNIRKSDNNEIHYNDFIDIFAKPNNDLIPKNKPKKKNNI